MRIIQVYSEAGIGKVCVEKWNGEKHRKNSYRPTQASLDRLADVVRIWLGQGLLGVRPFLGGCIGYVAQEEDF